MDPATATTVLAVLGSAFGVVFATMTTLMFVSIRVQHRDSIEIRTLVTQAGNENRGLIEQTRGALGPTKEFRGLIEQSDPRGVPRADRAGHPQEEFRGLIEQTQEEFRGLIEQAQRENRDLIEQAVGKLSAAFEDRHQRVTAQNHDTVSSRASATHEERLARIEGRLGIGGSAARDSGIGGSAARDSVDRRRQHRGRIAGTPSR